MTEILQIFSGNPMTTFMGKKVEAATRPELESDDWALNLEICDLINENDDDAKDAVRAIKKRLQQIEQDRNFTTINRTLTVLETCVSNCSRRFHVLVMTKDFIQDLVKLIGPKNNPPIDLQERVLRLIERWAEAFKSQPDLGGVVAVYNELKAKGVTFPTRDPNSNVPIQTPQRSVPPPSQTASPSSLRAANTMSARYNQQPSGPIVLEGDGYNKISQDLCIVQSSVDMFNEIMRVLESSSSEESDWKLASDLNSTCRQMKQRIVDLIERVANEDLTIELLRLNDDLNNIFIKYDRLVKNSAKSFQNPTQEPTDASSSSLISRPPPVTTPLEPKRTENELSLIDFNADFSREPQNSDTTQATDIDPFDSSSIPQGVTSQTARKQPEPTENLEAGLSRLNLDSSTTGKEIPRRLPEEISSVREQDFAEIENWLASDSGRDLTSIGGDMPSIEPISIPNSEFENFLANRALAGSSAPPTNTRPQQTSKSGDFSKPEPSV